MACAVCSVLLFCFVTLALAQKPDRWGCRIANSPEPRDCIICQKKARDVTLVLRNILKTPFFEEQVQINCTRYKTLFYIMQQAADVNTAFKFTASYNHAGHPGFFIDAMNNTFSTWEVDKSYWEILDGNLKHTPVGVSFYEPRPGETITFNLTIYTGPH